MGRQEGRPGSTSTSANTGAVCLRHSCENRSMTSTAQEVPAAAPSYHCSCISSSEHGRGPQYLGLCVGGLEEVVYESLQEFLAPWGRLAHCTIFQGDAGGPRAGSARCGKLLFSCSAPAHVISTLPCFITVLAFLGCHHGISFEKEPALQAVETTVRDSTRWEECFVLWAESQDHISPANPSRLSRVRQESGPFTFTYRASGLRDGQHDFNRMDMWPVMGSAVCARFGAETARVSLKEFDIEVVGLTVDEHMHVGLCLHPHRLFRHSLTSEMPFPPLVARDCVSTLRPSLAYLLVRLARPRAGDVVCDFMAGCGTIPVIAALPSARFPPCLCLGGDHDSTCIDEAAQNMAALRDLVASGGRATGVADMMLWDAKQLPLRDGCVDVGVTDLPFGKRCSVRGGVKNLFLQAFRDIARATRVGGRLIALVGSRKHVDYVLEHPRGGAAWRLIRAMGEGGVLTVNVAGLVTWIYCLERVAPPQEGMVVDEEGSR